MADTLAEVIRDAIKEYARLSRAVQAGDEPPCVLPDSGLMGEERFIARRIAERLLSDAVCTRAAALTWPETPVSETEIALVRRVIGFALEAGDG